MQWHGGKLMVFGLDRRRLNLQPAAKIDQYGFWSCPYLYHLHAPRSSKKIQKLCLLRLQRGVFVFERVVESSFERRAHLAHSL